MKVNWSRNATLDLIAIDALISKDSPRYANAVIDRVTDRTKQLAIFPNSGQMVPEYMRDDIREVIIRIV